MEEIQEILKEELLRAQTLQERKANMHRTPAPDYKIGDLVYVNAKDIKTIRPSKKLDYKNFGPYPIKRKVSPNSYEVQLPEGSRIHPVFSTSRLHPGRNDPLPGQLLPPPPPVILGETEAENEYEVEDILDSKLVGRWKRLKYLIRYKGWEPSWQPAEDLTNYDDLLKDFHGRYPNKPSRHGLGGPQP